MSSNPLTGSERGQTGGLAMNQPKGGGVNGGEWGSAVWDSAVLCCVGWGGVVWDSVVLCCVVWGSAVWGRVG